MPSPARWLLAVVLAALASPGLADCGPQPAVILPLLAAARPTIQATINGSPVEMPVDTGATRSIVTPDTVAAMRLPRDPEHRTRSASAGGMDTVQNAIVDDLGFGGLEYEHRSFAVLPLDNAARGPGGVIGTDIASHFDIELDMSKRKLTLFRAGPCKLARPPWDGPYQTIAATISSKNLLLFPVAVNGHTLTALLDTGSAGETMTRSAAHSVGVSNSQLESDITTTGTSGGGHVYTVHRRKFESLKIGVETFPGFTPDVADFDQGEIGRLVGVDYMKYRRFFLSFSNATLFVQRVVDEPRRPGDGATPENNDSALACRPSPSFVATLNPALPVAVSRPSPGAPPRALAERVDGCAGVKFHIADDGTPVDITLVSESQTGYGFDAFARQQLAASRFQPAPGASGWYYQARRYHVARAAPE